MIVSWHWLLRWRIAAAGLLAVAAFAWLAGRFWHPYYGFTKFVQLDEADARSGIHEVRENPVFTYPGFNGYDGAAYVQIAFHPLLDSPELPGAVGNVPYRARRILGSALAWAISGGNPATIATTYAALNLGVWLALAAILWRLLPVTDGRSYLAWIGVIFSAGALHSVRLALTDLLAATLIAGALLLAERGRSKIALGIVAMAGLARETALAAVAGLWRGPWTATQPWLGNLFRGTLVGLPLLSWMIYVRWKAGPAPQGFGNFTWPVLGWIEKGSDTLADFVRAPDYHWLNTTTLLALIALTAQAAYFMRRWRHDNAWWRLGASSVAMMALLGTSVWEGHPGAATRVLLPMGIAFAILATRDRAGWTWIAAGSLTIFSGVLALWKVHADTAELAAGRSDRGAYVAHLSTGWYGPERHGNNVWAWSAGRAMLTIKTAPRTTEPIRIRLKLRAISPREMAIRTGETLLWRGAAGEKPTWIEFDTPVISAGHLTLELHAAAAPVPENTAADARLLGFAVYGMSVR